MTFKEQLETKSEVALGGYTLCHMLDEDVEDMLTVCRGNTVYFSHCPPMATKQSLMEDLRALPPGSEKKDKHYLGIYADGQLVGLLDLIYGYPNARAAFIGFFMLRADRQRKGEGHAFIKLLLWALWQDVREVRLGYVSTNDGAGRFWRSCGFCDTGLVSHQELYDVVVLRACRDVDEA